MLGRALINGQIERPQKLSFRRLPVLIRPPSAVQILRCDVLIRLVGAAEQREQNVSPAPSQSSC
jgi:hypothetical protein